MGNKRIHKLFNELQRELSKAAEKSYARNEGGRPSRIIAVARNVDGAHHDYVEAVDGRGADSEPAT